MTPQRAKELLPIIEAYSKGIPIQFGRFSLKYNDPEQIWEDFDERNHPIFHDNTAYRIKPQPKLRPWKLEEIPVGAYLKCISAPTIIRPIIHMKNDGVCMFHISSDNKEVYKWKELLENYVYTTDNGKTWLPCGVEE